jgi:hypothetical protein
MNTYSEHTPISAIQFMMDSVFYRDLQPVQIAINWLRVLQFALTSYNI